jgi:hypothetical protein
MLLPSHSNEKEQDLFRTISITALLCGTLELVAAIIHNYFTSGYGATLKLQGREQAISFLSYLLHGGPENVCRQIASAAFDPSTNDRLLLAWGIVFHFAISFLFTVFLFLAYPLIYGMVRNRLIITLLYGLFTWAIMNWIVLPLSKYDNLSRSAGTFLLEELILTVTIGLPVAWNAAQYYRNKRKT